MPFAAAWLAIIAALPGGQDATGVQAPPPDPRASLPKLIELMRAGIEVEQPNNGWFRGGEHESVFDGSYDWHSCVIAHFALLNHGRLHEDDELIDFVLARLDGEALRREAALLDERDHNRQITFPYDEAWLLMLLAELSRHERVEAQVVARVRGQVETRLLEHLEASRFPEGVPEVDFCGFYRSWLFTFFLVQLAGPSSPEAAARLESLRTAKLEPARARVAALDASHEWDFLWLPAVLALVDRTESAPVASPYDPGGAAALPRTVTISTVHQLGVSLSRLWPCAFDAREDRAARERFEAGTRALLARRDLWAEDFSACSHWVPQYLWLGFWFQDGCR